MIVMQEDKTMTQAKFSCCLLKFFFVFFFQSLPIFFFLRDSFQPHTILSYRCTEISPHHYTSVSVFLVWVWHYTTLLSFSRDRQHLYGEKSLLFHFIWPNDMYHYFPRLSLTYFCLVWKYLFCQRGVFLFYFGLWLLYSIPVQGL